MRFTEVEARLTRLPDLLPSPPSALDPVAILDPVRRSTPARPDGGRSMRDAAVLALLFPDPAAEARIVLIRRPAGDYRHAGEVSLPGGAIEPEDEGPEAAALREAAEEVGLDARAAGVRLIGRLDPVEVRVTGFRLLPVLALAGRLPALRPDRREVESILDPSVDHFLPGAQIEILEAVRQGWRLRYGAFPADGAHVWGATARILGQLGAILAGPA